MIFVCFLQRLHAKLRISPSRPAGSGECQTRWAFALQWEQMFEATCVGDVRTACGFCLATNAPGLPTGGRNKLPTSDPDGSVRCFSAPDQPRKKLTATRAGSAAAEYPSSKFFQKKLAPPRKPHTEARSAGPVHPLSGASGKALVFVRHLVLGRLGRGVVNLIGQPTCFLCAKVPVHWICQQFRHWIPFTYSTPLVA